MFMMNYYSATKHKILTFGRNEWKWNHYETEIRQTQKDKLDIFSHMWTLIDEIEKLCGYFIT